MKEKRTKGKKSNGVVDRQYRRMELSSKFWNKIDPANRFRHWYLGAVSVTRSLFRVVAAKQTVIILLAILVILYILAAFYTGRGEFVIRLDRPMANEGFLLSETQDFSDMLVTLRDDAVEDATNITITDIAKDVMDVDGKHNGANYVAYTFYLKNKTLEEHDYHYELTVQSTSKNVDTASWIMRLPENGNIIKGKMIFQVLRLRPSEILCDWQSMETPIMPLQKPMQPMGRMTKVMDISHAVWLWTE